MKKHVVFLLLILSLKLYAQTDFVITCGPYLQNVTQTEANIMWMTNKNAVSWVELAPDDSLHFYAEERPRFYQTFIGKKQVGTMHSICIKNLKPGKGYRYRIYSQEVLEEKGNGIIYGKVIASAFFKSKPYKFNTLVVQKTAFSFDVVNDIHENNELLNLLLGNVKSDNVDFVIYNGDMVSSFNSREKIIKGFLSESVRMFATEIPFYYARGNHETRWLHANEFMNYFPTPTGLPYYTFQQGNTFFIMLDSGEDKPDSDIEYSGLSAYDEYRGVEQEWLKGVVKTEAFKNAAFKVVIMHICPILDTWHGAMQINKLFVPILNEVGIDLMLCGHKHRHIFSKAGNGGCNFPILVNSNKNKVHVDVTQQNLVVNVYNEKNKPEFDIKLNKK